jgi:tetratricopeptide (TPR) repeat protein
MKRVSILLTALFIILAPLASCSQSVQSLTIAELLDLGEKYLLELDYEQAIVQFTKLIEIEPKNARAYTGAAEAYTALGRADEAIAILEQGLVQLPDNEEILSMLEALRPPKPPETPITPTPSVPIVELTEDQRSFLAPLETAVLNLDVDTAAQILKSQEFANLCSTQTYTYDSFETTSPLYYKDNADNYWSITQSGVSYFISTWQGTKDTGVFHYASTLIDALPTDPDIIYSPNTTIQSCPYSNGYFNGERYVVTHIYGDAGASIIVTTVNVVNSAKDGAEIETGTSASDVPSYYKFRTTWANGKFIKHEFDDGLGGGYVESPIDGDALLGHIIYPPHPENYEALQNLFNIMSTLPQQG